MQEEDLGGALSSRQTATTSWRLCEQFEIVRDLGGMFGVVANEQRNYIGNGLRPAGGADAAARQTRRLKVAQFRHYRGALFGEVGEKEGQVFVAIIASAHHLIGIETFKDRSLSFSTPMASAMSHAPEATA